jgi:outer membrane protein OmpA-like peptidoglycan-associated protein
VSLDPSGAEVSGPRGRIQIELGRLSLGDAGDHAVLLNGKTANYFVGHVDEFNNDIGLHQELIVPPGSHVVTVTRRGKEVWSGTVNVEANKRVIINISSGKETVNDWPRGTELKAVNRFKAGTASATVAIAPVSSAMSSQPGKIDCDQSADLKWTSAETIDADMSGMSPVPTSGDKSVSPKTTTTYELTATGPGGVTKSSATVEVNPVVTSALTASPAEVQYHTIGDKTVSSNQTTLNWSASNADAVSLAPFGTVDANGSKSVPIKPTQTTTGPVDETLTYTLTATNTCGGSETKTASVHVTGSIDAIPDVLLHSVFFPTDYPTHSNPELGLVRSQQEALTSLAATFTKYLQYDPDAKLALSAYADERGGQNYNQGLSDMRAQRVKEFLVTQGISADKITTQAYGEDQPLDKTVVEELQKQDPSQPADSRPRNARSTWLAYNRRVDVILLPANRESVRFYPNAAPDFDVLWQRAKPTREQMEQNK